MKKARFEFDFSDLKLTVSQVENVIGYKEGEEQEIISNLISDVLKEAEEICRVKAEYVIHEDVKFNDSEKSLEINNLVFQIKKIVYVQLKRSESIAVFLCTAGEEIGSRSRKSMKEGDLLQGYIYDIVGSEIVEAAADLMQDSLETEMARGGVKITNRYSPGYCGWYVAEQHKLFQLIPDNYCGIRLTESALMDPIKSVSGFIGIGEKVKLNPYTCNLCDMKDCIYRKLRGQKGSKV
jgi:hypothetical protein